MVESGAYVLGEKAGMKDLTFILEEVYIATESAAASPGWGNNVTLTP